MDWTAIIVALISSGAVSAIINLFVNVVAQRRALRYLILGELREVYKDLMSKAENDGGVSHEDFSHFAEVYKVYKSLGGDGFADKMKSKVDNLDILIQ